MTTIYGFLDEDKISIIADSLITSENDYIFENVLLQDYEIEKYALHVYGLKVHILDGKIAIAYAGNVEWANLVINKFREYYSKNQETDDTENNKSKIITKFKFAIHETYNDFLEKIRVKKDKSYEVEFLVAIQYTTNAYLLKFTLSNIKSTFTLDMVEDNILHIGDEDTYLKIEREKAKLSDSSFINDIQSINLPSDKITIIEEVLAKDGSLTGIPPVNPQIYHMQPSNDLRIRHIFVPINHPEANNFKIINGYTPINPNVIIMDDFYKNQRIFNSKVEIERQKTESVMRDILSNPNQSKSALLSSLYPIRIMKSQESKLLEYMQERQIDYKSGQKNKEYYLLASNNEKKAVGCYFSEGEFGLIFIPNEKSGYGIKVEANSENDFITKINKMYEISLS